MSEPSTKSKRGIVCCFCGQGWGYEGDEPTEGLIRNAVEHEKTCPENPYTKEISMLRAALVAARKHILERNGLCKDSDRAAAIEINRALLKKE